MMKDRREIVERRLRRRRRRRVREAVEAAVEEAEEEEMRLMLKGQQHMYSSNSMFGTRFTLFIVEAKLRNQRSSIDTRTRDLKVTHAFDVNVPLFLEVPRLMHCTLNNKEDSVKVGALKYDGGFHQEGLYGVNIIGRCLGFVNEDALVNEVAIVLNTFRNELAKIDAQYPDGDTRFLG
ncbi:uncharacterized protein A4U43_C10F9060 [Asparagus officinalis]|uniref:Uncharacterized protein n=1 Tax=Asparagus officinalis TaxID=4686 RepID=A0A5P1E1K2_ASPOF|nr:uncharacterized protein A4U43_C10F9060 [Asparagus officinalis]